MSIYSYFRTFLRGFAIWNCNKPIDSLVELKAFVADKSAYVAQTTLFGYLRTRSGLQHFQLFSDDQFIAALRPARGRVFVSCAADLSVHCAARIGRAQTMTGTQMQILARDLFMFALRRLDEDPLEDSEMSVLKQEVEARLALTVWADMGQGEHAFERSIRSVIAHAPIIESLKEMDDVIVMNSVRFKWQSIRAELTQRLDTRAIAADILPQH